MRKQIQLYISLTKPRIALMVVITAALGFFLASGGVLSPVSVFAIMLLGTWLSCSGASVLNQYLERDVDARMRRTCLRPLPRGQISPLAALSFGIFLTLAGTSLLVVGVNLLTGFLALLTSFLYVLVYTPLKRTTWLNTAIGAIPGALPPMGGWSAATGELGIGAWLLFCLLFLWQHPHFYAIAWMYREDYERGGLKMLPVVEPDGIRTFRQILGFSLLLLGVSVVPFAVGMSGSIYLVGAVILGAMMVWYGWVLSKSHSVSDARKVLRASIAYLPLLLILLVADLKF
jgi:protoheme IX farnesyltransferase